MSTALSVGVAVVGVLSVITLATANSLLSAEARAWLPHLAQWLIRSSARQLQRPERDRYEDEWLAELAAWSDRPLSALLKAVHIRWNVRAMRASLGGYRVSGMRVKRAFDVVATAITLTVVAPVLAFSALAVRLSTRGAIIRRNVRVGRDGKPFLMLTFRTMYRDVDEDRSDMEGRELRPDDPRLTPIGRAMRRGRSITFLRFSTCCAET